MVRKIQSDEYLKRYDKMTVAERQAYKDRVGQWLRYGGRLLPVRAGDFDARLQNVLMVSVSWNDAECQAFEEGAQLLSALVNSADTWLPDLLYIKSAKRAINNMIRTLSSISFIDTRGAGAPVHQKPKEEPSGKTLKEAEAVGGGYIPTGKPAGTVADTKAGTVAVTSVDKNPIEKPTSTVAAVPVRPKHIDQYVHLLPVKTQERAAKVKDLLRELDYAREKARLLMGSPQSSPDDMAVWAKKATACDNAVRRIYNELDAEWEKLVKSGRIEVDVFGNARVVADGEPSVTVAGREKPELTSEQKHRRRELRKWLIDTRRGTEGKAREKRIEQWKENWKEYLTLESLDAALKDEKIVAASAHFGIDIKDATKTQHTEKDPVEKEQSFDNYKPTQKLL